MCVRVCVCAHVRMCVCGIHSFTVTIYYYIVTRHMTAKIMTKNRSYGLEARVGCMVSIEK